MGNSINHTTSPSKPPTLQMFFLKEALIEKGIDPSTVKLIIDHRNGKDYINDDEYNVIFTQKKLNYIKNLNKEKTIEYYFSGNISKNRLWIKKYENYPKSIIVNSKYGRKIDKKYQIDTEYFENLSKTKFALCPVGTCKWSYRFFESIMCFCIPVLENRDDLFCKDYFCYYDNENTERKYDLAKAYMNYLVFISNKHFL